MLVFSCSGIAPPMPRVLVIPRSVQYSACSAVSSRIGPDEKGDPIRYRESAGGVGSTHMSHLGIYTQLPTRRGDSGEDALLSPISLHQDGRPSG